MVTYLILCFIFYNFIFLFSKSINRIKYSVGRESIFAVVAHTLSPVRVFHLIASRTLSAVRVFHPVASRTLSAVTIFAQIAEVLCRLSEYFRSWRWYSVGRWSTPSCSIAYSVGRWSIPSRSLGYSVGRHDTCANRESTLSAVRVLPLAA